jgi:hypothetical protein
VKTTYFVLSLIVGLIFAASVFAQKTKKGDDLASLQEAYREQVSKIDAKYAALKEKVPADYTNALNALEMSFTKKGDLDSVVAIRTERDRYIVAQDISSKAIVKSPPALKALQERFQKTVVDLEAGKKKDIAASIVPYLTRLEQLKTNLTKSSKVDDALLVKQEIDRVKGSVAMSALISQEPGISINSPLVSKKQITRTPERLASIAFHETMGYTIKKLRKGVSSHNNDNRPWTEVPKELDGHLFTQMVSDKPGRIEITFKTTGMIYILIDKSWAGYSGEADKIAVLGEKTDITISNGREIFEAWIVQGKIGDSIEVSNHVLVAEGLQKGK